MYVLKVKNVHTVTAWHEDFYTLEEATAGGKWLRRFRADEVSYDIVCRETGDVLERYAPGWGLRRNIPSPTDEFPQYHEFT